MLWEGRRNRATWSRSPVRLTLIPGIRTGAVSLQPEKTQGGCGVSELQGEVLGPQEPL